MQHVLCCLLKVGSTCENGKRNFFWDEIYFQDTLFLHGVGEVATVATIVFQRWTNVPTNFAVLSERGSGGSRDVGNNFCTRGSKGSAIVVELAKHGGMCRKGWMDARGSE